MPASQTPEAQIKELAYDHAISNDLSEPGAWVRSCLNAYYLLNGKLDSLNIHCGQVFQCLMLAQMGFISGPTDIRNMSHGECWTALAA